MCGPIAAAASATADASSVFIATAVMLPVSLPRAVSVRGRSLVDVIGVVEEVDIPRRLPEPGQQHGRVAELLLGVRVDVQHVVPERKTLLRRRTRLEVVDLLQLLVVERREPRPHLPLVAAPMVDERGRPRIVGRGQLLLPFGLGLVLESRAAAPAPRAEPRDRGVPRASTRRSAWPASRRTAGS